MVCLSSATSSKVCSFLPVADRNKHPILNVRVSDELVILECNYHVCWLGLLQLPTKRDLKKKKKAQGIKYNLKN